MIERDGELDRGATFGCEDDEERGATLGREEDEGRGVTFGLGVDLVSLACERLEREPLALEPLERDPLERELLAREPLEREPLERVALAREPLEREPLERAPLELERDGGAERAEDPESCTLGLSRAQANSKGKRRSPLHKSTHSGKPAARDELVRSLSTFLCTIAVVISHSPF